VHPPDPYRRIASKLVDLILALSLSASIPRPLGVLSGFLYLCFADGVFRGQSLGKFLFRFKVIGVETLAPCGFIQSLLRNLYLALLFLLLSSPLLGTVIALVSGCFVIPTDLYALFFRPWGERIGDLIARTRVIPSTYEALESVEVPRPE
jgi:uncharacterized RDD family membrane protein YckC